MNKLDSYKPSFIRKSIQPTRKSYIKKLIHTPTLTRKYSNIKDVLSFIDVDTQKVYDIKRDRDEVKKLMLKNLKRNKYINADHIVAPKQNCSNCWFNVLFMIYFISDKGRTFTKQFRYAMINMKYDTSLVKASNFKKIKDALFNLNIAIEASLTGATIAKKMNTNEIITSIYESFKHPKKWVKKRGQYGNALDYYMNLIDFLYPNKSYPVQIVWGTSLINNNNLMPTQFTVTGALPHMFVCEIYDNTSRTINTKRIKITISSEHFPESAEYILDSVCIRDVEQQHVGALITLNKHGYFFDGDSPVKLKSLNWNTTTFLNDDKLFSFGKKYSKFNLRNGYQILYYYRI